MYMMVKTSLLNVEITLIKATATILRNNDDYFNCCLRWLPRVLRPRPSWAIVWREILNPREVHAKNKNKDGFPFP